MSYTKIPLTFDEGLTVVRALRETNRDAYEKLRRRAEQELTEYIREHAPGSGISSSDITHTMVGIVQYVDVEQW